LLRPKPGPRRWLDTSGVRIDPFADAPGETSVGIIIFFPATDEEARTLAESNPFVLQSIPA
jgi:hypothetical protein